MKDHKQQQLRKELRDASAKTAEIEELVPIASRLSLLKHSVTPAVDAGKATTRWQRIFKPIAFGVSGLALGVAVIVISQSVLPTSQLYSIQKFSDNVAVSFHPQYRATVMMKRAQQVNELVAGHASSGKVLATLADYTKEASAYKSTPQANYAAFEYCKTNLQQAASAASPTVRQAISSSLESLENI
jgi:hypothetical protein